MQILRTPPRQSKGIFVFAIRQFIIFYAFRDLRSGDVLKPFKTDIYLPEKAFKSSQIRTYYVLYVGLPCINLSRAQLNTPKLACPHKSTQVALFVLLRHHTTHRRQIDFVDKEDQTFTHPFLVLQAVQHRFPPRVLLWTSLCSCLHLPISEWELCHCLKSSLYDREILV